MSIRSMVHGCILAFLCFPFQIKLVSDSPIDQPGIYSVRSRTLTRISLVKATLKLLLILEQYLARMCSSRFLVGHNNLLSSGFLFLFVCLFQVIDSRVVKILLMCRSSSLQRCPSGVMYHCKVVSQWFRACVHRREVTIITEIIPTIIIGYLVCANLLLDDHSKDLLSYQSGQIPHIRNEQYSFYCSRLDLMELLALLLILHNPFHRWLDEAH